MKSSFREALARPAATPARSRKPSATLGKFSLRSTGVISRPVALAEELTKRGLSLGRAHAALERLVVGETVALDLSVQDQAEMVDRLERLGVSAAPYTIPSD